MVRSLLKSAVICIRRQYRIRRQQYDRSFFQALPRDLWKYFLKRVSSPLEQMKITCATVRNNSFTDVMIVKPAQLIHWEDETFKTCSIIFEGDADQVMPEFGCYRYKTGDMTTCIKSYNLEKLVCKYNNIFRFDNGQRCTITEKINYNVF